MQVAKAVRQGGGTISFEWPRYCLGWAQQPVLDFIATFNMSSVLVDGCAFGMNHKGEPIKKQWRIVTDHKRLLDDLAPWVCSKDHKHKEISGGLTPKTAYYNSLMCHVILNAVSLQDVRSRACSVMHTRNGVNISPKRLCEQT